MMDITPIADVLAEAERRGLRRAFFLTALMLEMDAVLAHLEPFAQVMARNGEVYECGIFRDVGQEWLVVVVESGAGNANAQSAVTFGHRLFEAFEVQIFVGVGGSRNADDAPLGTVVASNHVYFPYIGKYDEKKGWSSRPHSFPVDTDLVGLAKYIRRRVPWTSRIRPALNGTLPPADDYPVKFPPAGHVAPIASIEAVLADPDSDLEARIAEDYGDTCVVEMEGYGAMFAASQEHTPSILVRGVSDMTKDKQGDKDKTLQPIAAAHAAAFAFELLSQWGRAYSDPNAEGPARRRPASAVEASQTSVPPQIPAAPSAEVPARELILNLDMEHATVDSDVIGRLQADLRAIAGVDDIEILGTEPGSLRVIVRDPTGALGALSVGKMRDALAERGHAELLGVVDRPEFEQLKGFCDRFNLASAELLAWPRTLPDGEWIERPELSHLIDRIDQNSGSTTVLLGDPGAGKSALMSSLLADLQARGWPVLGIKADLLDPEIASEVDLKHRLNLPDLPSAMLERFAQFQPVVMVIDQLDALAGYLDIRTARLSVLLNLVRRLGRVDNVHIVLSARTFEFNHDVRLRAVSADASRLELPAWSQVLGILEAHGVMAAGWPDDAQQVMRSPQALATYLGLERLTDAEVFKSYQLMLDRLWAERVLGGTGGPERSQVACRIADEMAEEESLWLPAARFDAEAQSINALVAAGILTPNQSGLAIGFTHQTLFDYALSRSFAREHGRLSRFVLERQNSLFLRPKLWAALTYLREADPAAYVVELETIWRAPALREHLRLLLIEFVGQQTRPVPREVILMEDALAPNGRPVRALRAMAESPGWFDQFSTGAFADAMLDPSTAGAMAGVLSLAWSFAPDRVVSLLQSQWLPDPQNDAWVWHTLQAATTWTEAMLAAAVRVLSRTDVNRNIVDYVAGAIGVEQPGFAMRLVRAKLDHDLVPALVEMHRIASISRPTLEEGPANWQWHWGHDPRKPIEDIIDRSQDWDSLPALAEQDPAQFFAVLWPWYVEAFEAVRQVLAPRDGNLGYALPFEFDFRFDEEDELTLPEPHLLGAARAAALRWAKDDPEAFLVWAHNQMAYDLRPVHRLIAYAMASQPETFALEALAYLVGDPRRFYLGARGNHDTTLRLIAACAPFWEEAQVRQFEESVSNFRPTPPSDLKDVQSRRQWRNAIRWLGLDLLRALPKRQRSVAVDRHVEQEERRFGTQRMGVTHFGGGFIGSIMDAGAIARASDDDLVNAFSVLPDATEWSHPSNWVLGGNIQLAREFASFAKLEPDRAARIIDRLNPATGTRAAAYALDAMAESAPADQVIRLLMEVVERDFDGEEFRGSAARAVERLVNRKLNVTEDVLDLLERWLFHPLKEPETASEVDETPDEDKSAAEDKSGDDTLQRSLLWGYGGVSILPGGDYPVLEALARARLARDESDCLLDVLEAYLEQGRDARVWDNLFRLLYFVQPQDPARRTRFVAGLFDAVPGLIGTKASAQFIANAAWWDLNFVELQLDRWKDLPTRIGRQAYGELVGFVAVTQPAVEWAQQRLSDLIADAALVDARAGATLSAANLWPERKTRHESTKLITRTLPLGETGIWVAAMDAFRLSDALTPDVDTVEFLSCVSEHLSQAPRIGPHFIVERISSLLPHRAELVARIAQELVKLWKAVLGDIRTAHALASVELVNLAVTLHRLGPETREIGTAIFEELIVLDAYEARSTLDEIDNRFRKSAAPHRRRLQRTSSAPRRRDPLRRAAR